MFNIRKVLSNKIVHAQKSNQVFKLQTAYTISTPGSFFTEESSNYLNTTNLATLSYSTAKENEALAEFIANGTNISKNEFFVNAIKLNESNLQ
jgi:hypothetical protein